MELILGSLIMGVTIGFSGKVPIRILAKLNKFTTISLFFMLFALGAQIGSDSQLMANITVLGGRALTIALFAIAGSIAVLWAVSRFCGLAVAKGEE